MRLHRTYILRLLIDMDASGLAPELRGALQVLGEQQTYPFKSGQGLLSLLQEMIDKKPGENEIPDLNQNR